MENGYLIQERSSHDRRMTRVRLSQKALELTNRIDQLYHRNSADIKGRLVTEDQLDQVNKVLQGLERFWSNQVSYAR